MYSKLIVDGKLMYVYKNDEQPFWIEKLLHCTGIKTEPATIQDRIKYAEMEAKLKDKLNKKENHL